MMYGQMALAMQFLFSSVLQFGQNLQLLVLIRSRVRVYKEVIMLVKAIRNALGLIIVGVDKLTRPKPIQRDLEQQEKVQEAVNGLSLYQLYACPFCVKTRRALHQLGVDIELRDIGKQREHREALSEQGGRVMVPCLRIEEEGRVNWLYESNDIIAYLREKVGVPSYS